jgi:hypothetical protein
MTDDRDRARDDNDDLLADRAIRPYLMHDIDCACIHPYRRQYETPCTCTLPVRLDQISTAVIAAFAAVREEAEARVTALEQARRMELDTHEQLQARVTALEKVADENYSDLLDQMQRAWGDVREIGRAEIDAFLESRVVHKPTTRLRANYEALQAIAGNLKSERDKAESALARAQAGQDALQRDLDEQNGTTHALNLAEKLRQANALGTRLVERLYQAPHGLECFGDPCVCELVALLAAARAAGWLKEA